MKEWSEKNWFNSFNSAKGLLYQDHYKHIVGKEFLPPIEASIDPIHVCNLYCEWCNASRYLDTDYKMKERRIPNDHLVSLINFLAKWGVKGVCFGGGGEPSLHSGLASILRLTKYNGMESGVATNGTVWDDRLISTMAQTCRWVGVSVDAATKETYQIGRKADYFNKVLRNISKLILLVDTNNCDVAYKFLIFSHNQHEIYDACKIAKDLGARDFHARPSDFSHQGMGKLKRSNDLNRESVLEQFEKCHELETDSFRIFTVLHKFDSGFKPKKDFSQCYAAPLTIQICADGSVPFCVDQRHQKDYVLGFHYPDPHNILKFWGGDRHQQLVFGNTPMNCHTRCTYGVYNRQCEQLFTGRDPMCAKFP